MRDLVYYVAVTLDGFIAREDGSFSDFRWDENFLAELMALLPETFPAPLREGELDPADNRRFDAVLMGRRTYDVGLREGLTSPYPTLDQYVVSRSITSTPDPAVTLVSDHVVDAVRRLKEMPGRDIWLCGGGVLAAELYAAGLVDEIALKVNPVVFGSGVPMFATPQDPRPLHRVECRTFDSGHALMRYRAGRP